MTSVGSGHFVGTALPGLIVKGAARNNNLSIKHPPSVQNFYRQQRLRLIHDMLGAMAALIDVDIVSQSGTKLSPGLMAPDTCQANARGSANSTPIQ